MVAKPEDRGYATMRAYVAGDGSVSTVFSGVKGIPPETLGRILHEHRAELEALDPARSLILESILRTQTTHGR